MAGNRRTHLRVPQKKAVTEQALQMEMCASSPDEVPAVGAVGGLSQVSGHKLVSVDLVHPPTDGALTLSGTHPLPKHTLFIFSVDRRSCTQAKYKTYKMKLNTSVYSMADPQ